MKIAILGSSGAMGSFFVVYFLGRGYQVVGHDRVRGIGPAPPRFTFSPSNSDAVRGSDVVLIAVPIRDSVKVLREVAGSIGKGTLVVEISSVKGKSLGQVKRIVARSNASLLSLHPLFGPSISSQRFKLCVVGTKEDVRLARKLFPRARLIRLGTEEHDRLMAYVLSLVHLTNLAFVSAISKGVGMKRFQTASTPTSMAQLEVAKAILSQNPSLYSYIQSQNPFVNEVVDSMISELEDLRKIVGSRQAGRFEARFSSLGSTFDRRDLRRALDAVYSSSAR
ncbi:MAG: prephenate dehydrogenase/arogenate dehydrogenase family protein [Thaumarchaeota archaeon]|nr:prephenate dehydrogenase/arogenate dehydrogenase family protein [Nitrososphaerota archaeon]